jgi:hypothetical protein
MEFMHNAYGKFLPFTHDFKWSTNQILLLHQQI